MNAPAPDAARRLADLNVFWFLVDAPMFVDSRLVERLHDAIIRPSSIVVSEAEQKSRKEQQERKYGIGGAGDANVPFVVKLAIKGEFGHTYVRTDDGGVTQQRSIPRTSERLLEELVAFYLAHFPSRVLTVDPLAMTVKIPGDDAVYDYAKLDETCMVNGPRPLVLIDAPIGTKIMPMAGEFASGNVDVLYNKLVAGLSTGDSPMRHFEKGSRPKDSEAKAALWEELISRFEARLAMHVLEDSGRENSSGKFEWIDFRVPWGTKGRPSPLHLHVVPAGAYSMGTFAYAFVNRGHSSGIRIVGSLKSGGDINVLAIYDR